ncbi:MAG: hypothetical protein IJV83_02430 [Clostridia bacterium]|nr:hypothetical protein [Clostridia bacterium]
MAKPYDEYDYEPVEKKERKKKEKEIKKRRKKFKQRRRWPYVLLGFFLGFLTLPATIAGVVALVMTRPAGKTVETIDRFAKIGLYETLFGGYDDDGNPTMGILDQKYAYMKIGDIVDDVSDAIDQLTDDDGNLAALNNVSPFVGDTIDGWLDSLEDLEIPVDLDELLARPFKGDDNLGDYLSDSIMEANAGQVFSLIMDTDLDDMDTLLLTLCYGEENVDWTKENGVFIQLNPKSTLSLGSLVDNVNAVYEQLPIYTLFEDGLDDPIMESIVYGPEEHRNGAPIDGGKPSMKQVAYKIEDGRIYDYYISDEEISLSGGSISEIDGGKVIKVPEAVDNMATTDINGYSYDQYLFEETPGSGKWLAYTSAEKMHALKYRAPRVSDLSDDMMNTLDGFYLYEIVEGVLEKQTVNGQDLYVLDADASELIKVLLLGTEGIAYEVKDNVVTFNAGYGPKTLSDLRERSDELINDISLCSLISEDKDNPSALVAYVLYGLEGVHFERVEGKKIPEALNRFIAVQNGKAYNEYGEPIFENGQHISISNQKYTENGITYDLEFRSDYTVTLSDGTEANAYYLKNNNEYVKFKFTSLGDLSGEDNVVSRLTSRLQIKDILGEDITNDEILKHLANSTIDTLADDFEALTLQQVFGHEIFKNGVDASAGWVEGQEIWWYLLHNEVKCNEEQGVTDFTHGVEACGTYGLPDYKLEELTGLIDNMMENLHIVSLNELYADGILDINDTSILTSKLNGSLFGRAALLEVESLKKYQSNPDATLGMLNLEEAMDYLAAIFSHSEFLS